MVLPAFSGRRASFSAAARAAPEETPNTCGSAMGLPNTACMHAPEAESADKGKEKPAAEKGKEKSQDKGKEKNHE